MSAARSLCLFAQRYKAAKYFHLSLPTCATLQSRSIGFLANCKQCNQGQQACSSSTRRFPLLSAKPPQILHQQQAHAGAATKAGILSGLAERFGFKGKLRYKRGALQRSGVRMYLCAVELVDYREFFEELNLPDTFNSWFRITELHLWLCAVRLASEEREGTIIRNVMIKNLWDDVDKRTKKLGDLAGSSARRDGMDELSQQFRANLYGYDEGLLGSDRDLAGAIWRNFFEMQCDDAEDLEKLVHYVRRQVAHIENQNAERVVGNGILTFLPLVGDRVDIDRTKAIVGEILNRS